MGTSPRKRSPNRLRVLPQGPKAIASTEAGRRTKKKKVFTHVARIQLERRFRQLQPLEQFPFYGTIEDSKRIERKWKRKKPKDYDALAQKTGFSVQTLQNLEQWQREKESRVLQKWPPKTSIEEQEAAIKKMVRFKRGKRNKKRIVQTILTSEGKFRRLLFGGASQNWSEMNEQRRQRYQRILTEIIAKYAQTVSRRKGNTRKTIKQVRLNIVPELQRSKDFLEQTIQEKKQNLDQAGEIRLRNMVSVIDGLITKMSEPIPRERALIVRPTKTNTRPTIPFPGAAALEQAERGGVPASVIEEWVRQRIRNDNVKPLTTEEVRKAIARRDLEFRRMGLKHQIAQLERDLVDARQRGDDVAERIARQRLEGNIRRELGLDPRPQPVVRENAPVFGNQGGVRKWVDRDGVVHRLFVSRPTSPTRRGTELLPARGPTPEDYDRMYGGPTGVGFQTASKPNWRERTRERWTRIREGMKRLRKRMRRTTEEE